MAQFNQQIKFERNPCDRFREIIDAKDGQTEDGKRTNFDFMTESSRAKNVSFGGVANPDNFITIIA